MPSSTYATAPPEWHWLVILYFFFGGLHRGVVGKLFVALGASFAFFLASYTGVLLSVTNRPIWADTNLLGLLFLLSGASTAAAVMILLGRRRGAATARAVHSLS